MTSYNEWLLDYLMDGRTPTAYSDHPMRVGDFVIVENPEGIGFPVDNMTGAMSLKFVLNRNHDINEHARRFVGGHNTLYGWDKSGKPVCKSAGYGDVAVEVFSDTIDRQMVTDKKTPGNVRVALSIGHLRANCMKRMRDMPYEERYGDPMHPYLGIEQVIARECIKDALEMIETSNREYATRD